MKQQLKQNRFKHSTMYNLLKSLFLCLLGYCFVACSDKDNFEAITYPEMAPGMQATELITANPGEEIHIKAQLADIHGLKKVSISSETLPLEHSINLEGKVTYLLDYAWTIPQDVEQGSLHSILISIEGNTETILKEIELLASKATDYELMYAAYEHETEELWDLCLNKQALPRKMNRDAAYNYSITLYSPAAGTKVSLLGQKAMAPDIYGVNPDNPSKLALGEKYISLPAEGYYKLSVNLQTSVYTMDKVSPTLPAYKLYILGDLVNSGWDFVEGVNDMVQVYENNPYIVRRSLKFKDGEGGIKFSNLDWSVQINPLAGFTSWEDMGNWMIVDWDNDQTKDIWLPTPGGFYEVTLDYYLGEVTIISTEEETTEDYAMLYAGYEGESQEDRDNALTGLPRIAERTAPYTYSIELYSPSASTTISLASTADFTKEAMKVTLPEAGYYHIEVNLETKASVIEKIEATGTTYDKIYLVGSLTESGWDFKDDVNLLQKVYSDNPYLLRKEVQFVSEEDGDIAFSTADWTMWKPLKECSTWSEIKKWGVAGDNTQDIWWKAPTGTYEVTFDYFLGRVTVIRKR